MNPTPLALSLVLCLTLPATAAEPSSAVVLVGNYQSLGVDPRELTALDQALRTALESRPVKLVSSEETEKHRRSLALCGEDAACVGSAGERAGARWVLGYGAGKVGTAVLINVLWVDVVNGKTVATANRRVAPGALTTVAEAMVDEVLRGVELVPRPTPPPAPPPPAAALVPAEPPPSPAPPPPPFVVAPRPLRTVAIGTGVATGVFTGVTIVTGLLARSNYQALSIAPNDEREGKIKQQHALNLGADTALGLAIAAAAATVLFLLLDLGGAK